MRISENSNTMDIVGDNTLHYEHWDIAPLLGNDRKRVKEYMEILDTSILEIQGIARGETDDDEYSVPFKYTVFFVRNHSGMWMSAALDNVLERYEQNSDVVTNKDLEMSVRTYMWCNSFPINGSMVIITDVKIV